MKTLITDPFENDPNRILEWAYGWEAAREFRDRVIMGQRAGQAFMNTLYGVDPSEYNRLSGSLVDPFYDDARIPAAIDLLTSK